jgi:hypothetical protein
MHRSLFRTSVVLAGALLGAAGLIGCDHFPSRPVPSSTAPITKPTDLRLVSGPYCEVSLPDSWKTALTAGAIPHAADESLYAKAVSSDGSSVFAESTQGNVRELVWLHSGTRTVVTQLPDITHEVFGAAFDGRWLAFTVWDEPTLYSPWTIYGWDSQAGGVPRQLGRAEFAGEPYPIVYNGRAYWTRSVADKSSEVHMTDLASGQDRVIDTGWDGYPFRYGSLVVWIQRADAGMQLKAADLGTGQPAALPAELQEPLSQGDFANGDEATYVSTTYVATMDSSGTLQVRRAGSTKAVTVVKAAAGEDLQWPKVGGSWVTWDTGKAQFIADLRTGSYAQLTPQYGGTVLSGNGLVVMYAPAGTSTVVDSTLVDLSKLPDLPACP